MVFYLVSALADKGNAVLGDRSVAGRSSRSVEPVNGLQLYYEIRSSHRPLVLLHVAC